MSRSYQRSGWITDKSSKKFGKRFANKKVRRTDDIPSGKKYRRVYDPYNLCDFIFPCCKKGEDGWWKEWGK